jgi:uncharacterized protein YijF (DUF1287 family)
MSDHIAGPLPAAWSAPPSLRRFGVACAIAIVVVAWMPAASQSVEARPAEGGISAAQLVRDARSQIGVTVRYDPE